MDPADQGQEEGDPRRGMFEDIDEAVRDKRSYAGRRCDLPWPTDQTKLVLDSEGDVRPHGDPSFAIPY